VKGAVKKYDACVAFYEKGFLLDKRPRTMCELQRPDLTINCETASFAEVIKSILFLLLTAENNNRKNYEFANVAVAIKTVTKWEDHLKNKENPTDDDQKHLDVVGEIHRFIKDIVCGCWFESKTNKTSAANFARCAEIVFQFSAFERRCGFPVTNINEEVKMKRANNMIIKHQGVKSIKRKRPNDHASSAGNVESVPEDEIQPVHCGNGLLSNSSGRLRKKTKYGRPQSNGELLFYCE